jgi:hypothetical protein
MNEPGDTRSNDAAMERRSVLPYSKWWPFVVGIAVGLAARLVFSGNAGGAYTAMMASFLFLVPLLVGAVTVYIAETRQRRSWSYYLWAPVLANALTIVGTLVVQVEGLICAILVVPLFAVLGALGGLIMGLVCRRTNWPRQTLYGVALLPFLLGGVEHHLPLPDQVRAVERSRVISASPRAVWDQLHDTRDIAPHEVEDAWMYRIGVPLPVAGVTETTEWGRVRHVAMGRGIRFDQVATTWEPERRVVWAYRFTADSFPPRSLDDHVVIGGHYFDVRDTEYALRPVGASTELTVRMRYRVSTRFNWYVQPIADFLIGNFEEVILRFYGRRAEERAPAKGSSWQ